jgi:hypothetical protein
MVAFDDAAIIACDFVIARVHVHDRVIVRLPIIDLARSYGGTSSVSEYHGVYELPIRSVTCMQPPHLETPGSKLTVD